MSEESQSNSGDQLDRLETNLDRLEANVDRFVDAVFQTQRNHQVQLESQQEQINSLTLLTRQVAETQVTLMNNQVQLGDRFNEVLTRIDEMQSEIRGLQTENRRTLELLERRLPPEPES